MVQWWFGLLCQIEFEHRIALYYIRLFSFKEIIQSFIKR